MCLEKIPLFLDNRVRYYSRIEHKVDADDVDVDRLNSSEIEMLCYSIEEGSEWQTPPSSVLCLGLFDAIFIARLIHELPESFWQLT